MSIARVTRSAATSIEHDACSASREGATTSSGTALVDLKWQAVSLAIRMWHGAEPFSLLLVMFVFEARAVANIGSV
jgi:hypothetical protein